jgi:hypothetical protein
VAPAGSKAWCASKAGSAASSGLFILPATGTRGPTRNSLKAIDVRYGDSSLPEYQVFGVDARSKGVCQRSPNPAMQPAAIATMIELAVFSPLRYVRSPAVREIASTCVPVLLRTWRAALSGTKQWQLHGIECETLLVQRREWLRLQYLGLRCLAPLLARGGQMTATNLRP